MKSNFKAGSLGKLGVDTIGIEDELVQRKQFISEMTISPDEERTVIATINTPAEDADGEMVMSEGCDTSRYSKNSVVVWSHDYSIPAIGKATELTVRPDCVTAKIKFATTDRAEEVWQLVKGGFLKAHSVGFIVKKAIVAGTAEFKSYAESKGLKVSRTCKRIISEWILLEDSIVNLPANPEALTQAISAKSINVSTKLMQELGLKNNTELDMEKLADLIAARLAPKVATVVEPIIEPVVEPVKEATIEPVVEPVVEPIVPEPQPVEFVILPEPTLSQEYRDLLIAEVVEQHKKMRMGKVV